MTDQREIPSLQDAAAGLCLCTEPHGWTAHPCPGPAPPGTPADVLAAAAVSRALHVRDDPSGVLVEEDEEQPDGSTKTLTAEKTGFTLDPPDFNFYLATLARAIERYAADPIGETHG